MLVCRMKDNSFFALTVHSVHHSFLCNNFILLSDEQKVMGEQWSVHLMAIAGKKKTGCSRSGVGYVAAGSSHFGSQSP